MTVVPHTPAPGGPGGQGPAAPAPERGTARARLDSQALLRGARMVEIAHEGTVYRLQATRLGKLILTK